MSVVQQTVLLLTKPPIMGILLPLLTGKTEDGNTGVSSRILDIGESIGSGGTFTASRYGVLSWYAYAQPYGSKSGLGGYCTATAKSL